METKKVLVLKKTLDNISDDEMLRFFEDKHPSLEVQIATFKDIKIKVSNEEFSIFIDNIPAEIFNTILFRIPFSTDYAHLINPLILFCKHKKITLLNNIDENPINLNKLLQYTIFHFNHISFPKTFSYHSDYTYSELKKDFGETFIFKDSYGSRGSHNYLVHTEEEFEKIKNNDNKIPQFVIQEYIPNDFDYRAMVIGNKINSIIKRERKDKLADHRNNTTLGGTATYIAELNPKFTEISEKVSKALNMDIVGVDILEIGDKIYVLEANSRISLFNKNTHSNLEKIADLLLSH